MTKGGDGRAESKSLNPVFKNKKLGMLLMSSFKVTAREG
jgi:hypothetical protein